MNWSVGLITSPRPDIDVDHVFAALHRADWHDITVFGEPGTSTNVYPTGIRPRPYGSQSNWLCALVELYLTSPDADYFLLCEDDVTFCRNVHSYLDDALPRLGDFAAASLYTPPKHHRDLGSKFGWHNETDHGWEMWGTQAVVFSAASLLRFLASPDVLGYRRHDAWGRQNTHADACLGSWAYKHHERVYYHTPSLVQHLGVTSTVAGSHVHQAVDYVGDDFDASAWVGHTPEICRFGRGIPFA